MADDIKSLVETLAELQKIFDRLTSDEESPHQLGEPATDAQIQQLERRLGADLPQGYRDFLRLHNGWDNFEPGGKLLSTDDHDAAWVKEKLQFWYEIWTSDDSNPFESGAIPVMFGEDLSFFIVLDPSRQTDDGELEFIEFDDMYESASYPTFEAYLTKQIDTLREMIADEQEGDPEPEEGYKI